MAKVKVQETDNQVTPSSDGTTETQPASTDVDVALESNAGTACAMTNTTDSTRGSLSNVSTTSNNKHSNIVDDDSSAFDSSSDSECSSECDDKSIKRVIDRIPKELRAGECEIRDGALKIGPQAINSVASSMRPPPTIGSIALQNSSDITFGNKTYIKGQVVIKNIYKDRQNGHTNGAYENDACEIDPDNSTKKDPSTLSPSQPKSWQSNLKAIIKDKPLLSSFLVILLICFLCAVIAIICVLAATEDDLFPDPKPLRLVTRTEWLAQPPREELTDLKLPVNNVIIAHTATEGCTTQSKCMFQVKLIQDFHIMPESRNFSDIAYQFLVGGDGNGYEGRGWTKQGAHTKGFNVDSICIAFVGTFIKYKPPIAQLSAAQQLIKMGLDNNYIAQNYSLYGHRQLAPFESPGQALYDIIKTWPHWSDKLGSNHWTPEPEPADPEGSKRRKRNAIVVDP
ncbi:peptidoglycan-recognition protein LE-like isoform X3 [Anopheles aquasalis]|uniref:peptidoglycan-recognition protein LE-like isoform X3 n=1 Tax=Anopheles aquasalis TaxID=42839 RepID=UPI00215AB44D|nr:peptidoglycan-recognition protein LE-like isoform X3 [Anopheles aquasalis]